MAEGGRGAAEATLWWQVRHDREHYPAETSQAPPLWRGSVAADLAAAPGDIADCLASRNPTYGCASVVSEGRPNHHTSTSALTRLEVQIPLAFVMPVVR